MTEFQYGNGEFVIIEPEPSGSKSIRAALKWFESIEQKSNDATPLWKALTPGIKKAVNYEFSEANPNKWAPISDRWKNWKNQHGYPTTIGIRTGSLKRAVSDDAKVEYLPHKMNWMLNESIDAGNWGRIDQVGDSPFGPNTDKVVGDYAHKFDEGRHVFIYTFEFIQVTLRNAVKKFVKSITTTDN